MLNISTITAVANPIIRAVRQGNRTQNSVVGSSQGSHTRSQAADFAEDREVQTVAKNTVFARGKARWCTRGATGDDVETGEIERLRGLEESSSRKVERLDKRDQDTAKQVGSERVGVIKLGSYLA